MLAPGGIRETAEWRALAERLGYGADWRLVETWTGIGRVVAEQQRDRLTVRWSDRDREGRRRWELDLAADRPDVGRLSCSVEGGVFTTYALDDPAAGAVSSRLFDALSALAQRSSPPWRAAC